MTHEEKALSYFKDKFHCSQSVLAAYADELGLTEEQALKIAACFNAGMRKGEVCGACSGAFALRNLTEHISAMRYSAVILPRRRE